MHLLKKSGPKKPLNEILVSEETQDRYVDPRPINPLFERILFAVIASSPELKRQNLIFSLGLNREQAQANREIGVFSGSFDGWTCTINWTPRLNGKLPPGHALVSFGDVEVGIISPFLDHQPVDGIPSRNEWWGKTVKPSDLSRACARTVARAKDKKSWWEALGGRDYDSGEY